MRWLEARVHEGREAELLPRVDRRRFRIVNAAEPRLAAAIGDFRNSVRALDLPAPEAEVELDFECEPVPLEDRPAPGEGSR